MLSELLVSYGSTRPNGSSIRSESACLAFRRERTWPGTPHGIAVLGPIHKTRIWTILADQTFSYSSTAEDSWTKTTRRSFDRASAFRPTHRPRFLWWLTMTAQTQLKPPCCIWNTRSSNDPPSCRFSLRADTDLECVKTESRSMNGRNAAQNGCRVSASSASTNWSRT